MIQVISGTNRAGSNSRKVAESVVASYGRQGIEAGLLDMAELPAEAFSGLAYKDKPDALVERFIDPVLESDGLHVVVPEYNGSFPGVLKYFIDLLPFPESFECRPVAFIGLAAGAYGGLRPVEQLQMVFAYRNAYLYNRRIFMPSVYGLLASDGGFADADMQRRVDEQAAGFAAFVQALKSE